MYSRTGALLAVLFYSAFSNTVLLNAIMLIGFLWISVCLMSTTLVITFFDRFHTNGSAYPELRIRQILNETMTTMMNSYDTKFQARISWNVVQRRLKCCGKNGPADWFKLRRLPPCSCFLNDAASLPRVLYIEGCLERIVRDLILENSFLIGICLVTLCVHVSTLILAALMYMRNRLSRK